MSQKKYKKRKHSPTVNAKRQAAQERIADEKERSKNRMDPTARALLLIDLVFRAAISLLDMNGILPSGLNALSTIVGLILIVAALWFQFGNKNKSNHPGPKL